MIFDWGAAAGPNKYERSLLSNIEEHGWQATHVFDPNGEQPSFSYSIGFTKMVGAPEVIIFGLVSELMHSTTSLSNRLARKV